MNKAKVTILTKLIIGIFLPITLIMIIAGYFLIVESTESDKEMSGKLLEVQTLNAATTANDIFNVYLQKSMRNSDNKFVSDFLYESQNGKSFSEIEGYSQIRDTLKNIVSNDPNIAGAWICDLKSNQIMDLHGVEDITSEEILSMPWSKVTNTKNSIVTIPYLNSETDKTVVSAVSPITNSSGEVIAVSGVDINAETITDSLSKIKIGENGSLILVANDGTVIYSPFPEDMGTQFSSLQFSQNVKDAVAGAKTGAIEFSIFNNNQYGYIANISSTPWLIVSGISEKEFMTQKQAMQDIIFFVFVSGIILIGILILIIGKTTVKPLIKLNSVAIKLAEGDMNVSIDVKTNDEIGLVADSFGKTIDRLKEYMNYIDEISEVLNRISGGDFKFELKYNYVGNFEKIKVALLNFRNTISETIGNIRSSSDQVSMGAEHVAGGAQDLSQTSTEQASAVEELSSTIEDISGQLSETAQNTDMAKKLVDEAGSEVDICNKKMQELISAMHEINRSSDEISKIIKAIEDIAFQTNILALNAAVEAARAGSAGKGFAVVADEVRNLASKSADASKNTAVLIENSIESVGKGMELADSTAQSLLKVVDGTLKVVGIVDKISDAANAQKISVNQITQGINQISAVVQSNSATAEESAATSHELSSQALSLKAMVNQFKVN